MPDLQMCRTDPDFLLMCQSVFMRPVTPTSFRSGLFSNHDRADEFRNGVYGAHYRRVTSLIRSSLLISLSAPVNSQRQ